MIQTSAANLFDTFDEPMKVTMTLKHDNPTERALGITVRDYRLEQQTGTLRK
jgi:hypothetical protein